MTNPLKKAKAMNTISKQEIEHFLHGQVQCWNDGDRDGFIAHYKALAPNGLSLEYVGLPQADAWLMLEKMWDTSRETIRIEAVQTIIAGNEAACFHRNHRVNGDKGTTTIELYKFESGRLSARYFIGA
jgi:hypothetical protein